MCNFVRIIFLGGRVKRSRSKSGILLNEGLCPENQGMTEIFSLRISENKGEKCRLSWKKAYYSGKY